MYTIIAVNDLQVNTFIAVYGIYM